MVASPDEEGSQQIIFDMRSLTFADIRSAFFLVPDYVVLK